MSEEEIHLQNSDDGATNRLDTLNQRENWIFKVNWLTGLVFKTVNTIANTV